MHYTYDAPVVAFFDVDGTLVTRESNDGLKVNPTPAVRDALCEFAERGHIPVVCSARSIIAVEALRELPFAGYVMLDGTYVRFQDEVLFQKTIADDLLAQTLEELAVHEIEALLAGPHGCGVIDWGRNEWHNISHTYDEWLAKGGDGFCSVINVRGASAEKVRNNPFIMEHYEFLSSGNDCYELLMPETGKAVGAQLFLDNLPFKPARVFAFGDSENDLGVLRLADIGVVMGNATSEVQAQADYLTTSVYEDGVVQALRHFDLIGS